MDCNNCVWARRDGGCTSWDCEFIDKDEAVKAWKEKKTADFLQNIPKLSIDTDAKLMAHLLAEICGYAIENDMEPNDTIRTIANNFLALLEIATFNGWKGENDNEVCD